MKYDRRLLEKAVEIYPKKTNRNFVPVSKLSQKQLSNAIKHIDKFAKPEETVALLDSTLFSSGKEGILLTTEKIVSSGGATNAAYFEKFIKAECSGDEVRIFYSENSFRRIKVKTYADEVASLLNTIAKERLLAEKAELKKEEAELEKLEESKKIEEAKAEPAKPVVAPKPEPIKPIASAKPEPPKPAAPAKEELPKFELFEKEGTYRWYFRKALAGEIRAMLEIAKICEEEGRYDREEKWHEALFWNLRAAEEGSPWGAGNVGRIFENGIGVPANNEIALEWYQESPFHKNAYDNLKINIESGEIKAIPNEDEYDEFVQWAGDFGEISYENGMTFGERFYGYALIYISAILDYPEAQFALGKIYANESEIGKADHEKEYYWITKAYKNGNDDAATYFMEHNFFLR